MKAFNENLIQIKMLKQIFYRSRGIKDFDKIKTRKCFHNHCYSRLNISSACKSYVIGLSHFWYLNWSWKYKLLLKVIHSYLKKPLFKKTITRCVLLLCLGHLLPNGGEKESTLRQIVKVANFSQVYVQTFVVDGEPN